MTSSLLLGTFRSSQLSALLLVAVAALGAGCAVEAADDDLGIAEQPIAVCAALESDSDGDGHDAVSIGGDDCNDADPTVHPRAPEIVDGKDNDCNGFVDDVPNNSGCTSIYCTTPTLRGLTN